MATQIAETETESQIDNAKKQAAEIANSAIAKVEKNTFVYFVGFDGTKNTQFSGVQDPNKIPSGDSIDTAIGSLERQIKVANELNPNVVTKYIEGVGSPNSQFGSSILPMNQSIINAQTAYDDFARAAHEWLSNNPNGDVTTMIATFSRGW
jgi:hypothetical protein